VNENDIELLEAYCDDALGATEAQALRTRALAEPEFALAMDRVRQERQMRQDVFQSLEGSDAEVDRLMSAVRTQVRTADRWTHTARVLRYASAIAACIVIAFFAGFATRGHLQGHPGTGEPPVAGIFQVSLTDDAGKVVAVQKFDSLDKANEFARDLDIWQERQKQLQQGQLVLVADRF